MIEGPTRWSGTNVVCPSALPPAVVVLLAKLAFKGTSMLGSTYSIHRGYEGLLDERLLPAVGCIWERIHGSV